MIGWVYYKRKGQGGRGAPASYRWQWRLYQGATGAGETVACLQARLKMISRIREQTARCVQPLPESVELNSKFSETVGLRVDLP